MNRTFPVIVPLTREVGREVMFGVRKKAGGVILPANGGLGGLRDDGHFIVSTAIEFPAGEILPDAAPLFEEERDSRGAALTQDVLNPFLAHRSRFR